MPKTVVIRLHPDEPTTGVDFTKYLEGVVITAVDVSFDATTPREDGTRDLGQAVFSPNPNLTQIFQHISGINLQSVATAVIEVTQTWAEHTGPDVALRVERKGSRIAARRIDYNARAVTLSAADIAHPSSYQSIADVSLFFALPAVGREIDPTDVFVELPEDGSPPNFQDLLGAVMIVLEQDAGAAPLPSQATLEQLRSLTPAQCRHIANEIAYNRRLEPLPLPASSLEAMYTVAADDDARQQFEAKQHEYYAKHDAVAERLYGYITALAAAIACEHLSNEAQQAGLSFPVRVTPALADEVREAKLVLKN